MRKSRNDIQHAGSLFVTDTGYSFFSVFLLGAAISLFFWLSTLLFTPGDTFTGHVVNASGCTMDWQNPNRYGSKGRIVISFCFNKDLDVCEHNRSVPLDIVEDNFCTVVNSCCKGLVNPGVLISGKMDLNFNVVRLSSGYGLESDENACKALRWIAIGLFCVSNAFAIAAFVVEWVVRSGTHMPDSRSN